MKATHVGHNTSSKKESIIIDGKTGKQLELICQDEVVKMGGSCVLRSEGSKRQDGSKKVELDALINGFLTDILSVNVGSETLSYRNQITKKNQQIIDYIRDHPELDMPDTICLYFHDSDQFSINKLTLGIDAARTARYQEKGTRIGFVIKRIICIVKGFDKMLVFDT